MLLNSVFKRDLPYFWSLPLFIIGSLSLTESVDSLFTFPPVPKLSASLRAVYLTHERFKAPRAQQICPCGLKVVIIFDWCLPEYWVVCTLRYAP